MMAQKCAITVQSKQINTLANVLKCCGIPLLHRPLEGLQSTAVYRKEKIQGVTKETNNFVVVGGGFDDNRKKKGRKRPNV